MPCCDLRCLCVCCMQAAQPLAAKLLSGAQNVSFQANATRNAARQAVFEAQHKLAGMKSQLAAAKDTRHAAKQLFKSLPGQWGKSQFRVSATHSRHVEPPCFGKAYLPLVSPAAVDSPYQPADRAHHVLLSRRLLGPQGQCGQRRHHGLLRQRRLSCSRQQ